MRRVILTIHLWAGMTAALFLFALGVSGSMMAFENEIDRALNPNLTWITAGPARLTLAEMIAKLEAAYPGTKWRVSSYRSETTSPGALINSEEKIGGMR